MIVIQKYLKFYGKTEGDQPAVDNKDAIIDLNETNATKLFNINAKTTSQTGRIC